MFEATFKGLRGMLSAGVTLSGRSWVAPDGQRNVQLIYRGTKEALIAIGCLPPALVEILSTTQRRRHKRDENGNWFYLHRSPTKALPDRVKLVRHGNAAAALELPGMRELFPRGIAACRSPLDAWNQGASMARDWKRDATVPAGKVRPSFLRLVVDNTKEVRT
jgi:hypothetical protein